MNRSNRNPIDFEINLLPFISLLAVCISFLLLTAVWVQIGSTDISQALGSAAVKEANPPAIWVEFSGSGHLLLSLKNVRKVSKRLRNYKLSSQKTNWRYFDAYIKSVKKSVPELKMAMVLPKSNSSYENIIQVIDRFKKFDISDVGVAPL